MTYTVVVTDEAERNVDKIYEWIEERSPQGAHRWYQAFLQALNKLKQDADRYSLAHESSVSASRFGNYCLRRGRAIAID